MVPQDINTSIHLWWGAARSLWSIWDKCAMMRCDTVLIQIGCWLRTFIIVSPLMWPYQLPGHPLDWLWQRHSQSPHRADHPPLLQHSNLAASRSMQNMILWFSLAYSPLIKRGNGQYPTIYIYIPMPFIVGFPTKAFFIIVCVRLLPIAMFDWRRVNTIQRRSVLLVVTVVVLDLHQLHSTPKLPS